MWQSRLAVSKFGLISARIPVRRRRWVSLRSTHPCNSRSMYRRPFREDRAVPGGRPGRHGWEATGGYDRGVVGWLRRAGSAVLVLQPLQVKAYARLHLRRAKNDRLDAVLIAACAAALEAPPIAPDPRLPPLSDALTFIEQIEEDIARGQTRLEHIGQSRLRRLVLADITRLAARRAPQLQRLAQAVPRHADLARRLHLVQSVSGIGRRTPLCLIPRPPHAGHLHRRQAAALSGVAPV